MIVLAAVEKLACETRSAVVGSGVETWHDSLDAPNGLDPEPGIRLPEDGLGRHRDTHHIADLGRGTQQPRQPGIINGPGGS
nr:hypothetical protein [Mycolicibacterium sp. lyk4-40-TYG-92]